MLDWGTYMYSYLTCFQRNKAEVDRNKLREIEEQDERLAKIIQEQEKIKLKKAKEKKKKEQEEKSRQQVKLYLKSYLSLYLTLTLVIYKTYVWASQQLYYLHALHHDHFEYS